MDSLNNLISKQKLLNDYEEFLSRKKKKLKLWNGLVHESLIDKLKGEITMLENLIKHLKNFKVKEGK